ncbi:MAG: putative ABC transporter permease subunit, partial [Isosphaeraceae bacterium]
MSLAIPEPIRLPDLARDRTARALRWLRWRQVRNTTTNLIQGSRLRIAMILFCSAVFWAGLFILFLGGFQFISLYVDLANTIVEYLFSMFFLSLLVMLFFSSGIIVYTTLFHSREAAYLLTTPASTDRIFAYTFAEALGFSSWGFFLLGSPLMVAYGLTVKAPAAFYAMFLLYLLSFVLIPGSVGAVAAITVANIFPRRQKTVLTLAVAGVLALLAILGIRLWRTPGDTLSGDWLGSMLNRLAFCQNPL